MRIVFMGTPEFAIPSLRLLLEEKYDVVAAVTAPDKPSGRGREISRSAVKEFSEAQGLGVLQPEKLSDDSFIRQLTSLQPDLFVVVAFRILPPKVFTIPSLGAFNLHASLLPKYRGAAPINWAIIRGEKETGVTTFFLKETVDTGNIILQARVPIREDDTAGDLYERLSAVGAEIVLHTVRLIELGKANPKVQDDAAATPAPKIFKEDCRINWKQPAADVHNFVRGLSPRPCAYTMHQQTTLKIYKSKTSGETRAGSPGEILQADSRLIVSAEHGAVEVLELQQEGKKKLSADAFLRGYRIEAGEKFE